MLNLLGILIVLNHNLFQIILNNSCKYHNGHTNQQKNLQKTKVKTIIKNNKIKLLKNNFCKNSHLIIYVNTPSIAQNGQ